MASLSVHLVSSTTIHLQTQDYIMINICRNVHVHVYLSLYFYSCSFILTLAIGTDVLDGVVPFHLVFKTTIDMLNTTLKAYQATTG